ncbi:hypothetical protein A9G41_07675 [Gilliamella sp. Nev5-1]|uniref:hypothetical protein n=1 Tax=unclassified Gilliamella TaxID=2685620 RepID=UPI00080E4305|nr:hypothetical protein [Gilliamella apicola]OCG60992.1 hypothetical protein A9G40_02670 [Gilliamella apicola]OCG68722.1 hypothetical protein A9G41_07675 [Gilliamella apicola]
MKKRITKRDFNKIISGLSPFFFSAEICAQLVAQTVKSIEGTPPSLSPQLEKNIEDLELFGLAVDNKNYYGNEVTQLPISSAYPLKSQIKIAPIKQPDTQQYVDVDGDELGYLTTQSPPQMIWYYTDTKNQMVEFTPAKSDTLCSLAEEGKLGPYKIKILGDLILTSKYGNPSTKQYPNNKVTQHPSKTYTISPDAGFCYAKPELQPDDAKGSAANQWDEKNGFLTQSNIDASRNFPTTAFYGAKFDLLLAKNGLAQNYIWKIIKGDRLVTISSNADTVAVMFNTEEAKNTKMAWDHIMKSDNGYTVIIQGKNKITGKTIEYSFTITKWFSGWDKNLIGQPRANRGSAEDIVSGCKNLDGNYRISHANEVSNAPKGKNAKFTREIGTLLGEWGDPNQNAYPNSWAAAPNQSNSYKRLWLYDEDEKEYCDLHTYNAVYHCRGEGESKNGICTAIK